MPALSPFMLVDSILEAIRQSSGSGAYISPSVRTHPEPRCFLVRYLGDTFSIWVYIWTLTHGGRVTLPNEYRIQMTSVTSPLALNPDGYTALLGYYHDLGIFAGFDIDRHHRFTTGSPSVQINIEAIHGALQHGLAFTVKENREIAVGIRPDQFLNYIQNARILHQQGRYTQTMRLLVRAAQSEEIPQQEIDNLPIKRQRIVSSVRRYARQANFRDQVLHAYDHRCALTRQQLRLVEAAHILPVPVHGSIDHVTNGIALSPTIHRAFDNCLIYVDENYIIRLNEQKADDLISQNLHAGLNQLRNQLNTQIHLPVDQAQRPNPQFIIDANRYRRIRGYY